MMVSAAGMKPNANNGSGSVTYGALFTKKERQVTALDVTSRTSFPPFLSASTSAAVNFAIEIDFIL